MADRFWEKVEQTDTCWLWRAAIYPVSGYGAFSHKAHRATGAHRIAWVLTFGAIPEGMQVLHHCDNRPCVRPSHLFLGTQMDNIHDMIHKNRQAVGPALRHRQQGELNNRAKLTQVQVDYIRASTERPVDLANRFGVTYKNIWKIRAGHGWT